MGRYRKKPVVVEAIQWNDNTKEIEEFCGENCSYLVSDTAWEVKKGTPIEKLVIHTLEGDMVASRGDYIIKGVNGEFYPCKPDIFEKTYEIEVKVYKTGRLIDADALIEDLDKREYSREQHDFKILIKKQPTVYDVEKVVDVVREDCYSMGFDESQTEIIVNDIVKAGGVE